METISIGYLPGSLDPHRVGVGGVWDFDTDVAGTDSTQAWRFLRLSSYGLDPTFFPTVESRPQWYFDYGNAPNQGDHGLWRSRLQSGRTFRRHGLIGMWHSDGMAGVSSPITGSRSAWCGLRPTADPNAIQLDELTGNPYTIEAVDSRFSTATTTTMYPGYGNHWDQILYRDFPYGGLPVTIGFRVRTDLSTLGTAGMGWFNPNPPGAQTILGPADSLMLWVGKPREGGYDPNRRWLSDVLDFTLPGNGQPQKLVALTGRIPVGHAGSGDSTVQVSIPGGLELGGVVRVAFQVKTNALRSDDDTPNSIDGAALIDQVDVGGVVSDFESEASIRPRVLLDASGNETWVEPSIAWITTGRPPTAFGHIEDVSTLPYDDPLGPVGDPNRICNLAGNVMLHGDHDALNHRFAGEIRDLAVSPTIALAGPRATLQGIPASMRSEASHMNLQFDYYPGNDGPAASGVFFWYRVRVMGPTTVQPQSPMVPQWTDWSGPTFLGALEDGICRVIDSDAYFVGKFNISATDSLQVTVYNEVRCTRWGISDCGDARGGYFDNVRVQFIRDGIPFTGVDPSVPGGSVQAAFPNPTRDGATTIRFELPRAVPVTIRFYDLRGALVHEESILGIAGPNRFAWGGRAADGERLAPGMYWYRVVADGVRLANDRQRLVVVGADD